MTDFSDFTDPADPVDAAHVVPPQKTVEFAIDAEEKLRLAWLRKNKKTGEKGSVASASDLAAMFMGAEQISEEANQQASAEVSADLDDFLTEFGSIDVANTAGHASVNGAKIAEKAVEQSQPAEPSDAFKELDDFLN